MPDARLRLGVIPAAAQQQQQGRSQEFRMGRSSSRSGGDPAGEAPEAAGAGKAAAAGWS